MTLANKLNSDLIKNFCEEIEDGLPIKYTCDLFSISRGSYRNWIQQGEYDADNSVESIYAEFFISVKKAYARYIRHIKNRIKKGEPGWQGEAWWLERTNKDFRMTEENDVTQETVVVNPSIKPNHESKCC